MSSPCRSATARLGAGSGARVSTDAQDLTAQREALIAARVAPERVYVDHGRSGTTRARPGLEKEIAACWAGDALVVTKLDRLARSAVDASTIADELAAKDVRLSFNGSVYDTLDPMGRMIFGMLSVFAEFEANLVSARTREGMATARAKGRLKGRKPKLSEKREAGSGKREAGSGKREAGSAPSVDAQIRRLHLGRARRTVRRRPRHRVPSRQ